MNKHLIIFTIAVLLICIGLSGCIDIDDGISDIETITISGIDEVRDINYLDKPIKLDISGIRNIVTVSKNTNLVEIVLSGIDNIVRVSRSHSFDSSISGIRTEIVYYD